MRLRAFLTEAVFVVTTTQNTSWLRQVASFEKKIRFMIDVSRTESKTVV